VGVFNVRNPDDDGSDLEQIYIPLTTLQRAFNRGNSIGFFGAVAGSDVDAALVEEKITDVLKKRHRVAPEDPRAIGSWNSGEEFSQLQALFRGIRIFLWIVGSGTIIAGIVGVSNIMLIIVKERTKEIGIRKALGATPFSIISLILQESIFITAISGYMGLVASVGLIELSGYLMNRFHLQSDYFSNPEIDFNAAITATIILIITGALAGYIPARTAAKINPIEALRSD
jgi:putative ABC transport system permease protein